MIVRIPLTHGPDVSHYEPVIDFHAIKGAGMDRVICKATEGSAYTDPTYSGFADRCRSVGLAVFAYAFLDPGNALAQTAHYCDVTHLQPGDGQPIVDAERQGLDRATTFLALHDLERRGFQPILYASLSFWEEVLLSPNRWALWLAAYRPNLPTLPDSVTLFGWQHTDIGICPGIAHPVDMSYFYGDLETFLIKPIK